MIFSEWGRDGDDRPTRLSVEYHRPRLLAQEIHYHPNGKAYTEDVMVLPEPPVNGRGASDTRSLITAQPGYEPAQPVDPNCPDLLHVFEATDWNAAMQVFLGHKRHGLPGTRHDPGGQDDSKKIWHFRGHPHYTSKQARRLKVTDAEVAKTRENRELREISATLGGLCQRYHVFMTTRGCIPPTDEFEMRAIKSAIAGNEGVVARLHCVAAASAAMLDHAYKAFGFEAPERPFAVLGNHDPIAKPATSTESESSPKKPTKANAGAK